MTTAQLLRFPNLRAPCRCCGTRVYTMRELNLSPGQDGRCYHCFDLARGLAPHVPAPRR